MKKSLILFLVFLPKCVFSIDEPKNLNKEKKELVQAFLNQDIEKAVSILAPKNKKFGIENFNSVQEKKFFLNLVSNCFNENIKISQKDLSQNKISILANNIESLVTEFNNKNKPEEIKKLKRTLKFLIAIKDIIFLTPVLCAKL